MSAPIDDGGPAFPLPPSMTWNQAGGMSLRDWLAGQALAGMHASLVSNSQWPHKEALVVMAERAYASADEMLAERKHGGAA